MKIAIPVMGEKLCAHFGHCENFTFVEVDKEKKEILSVTNTKPPVHQPGILPEWIKENGINLVIAGGMGSRAKDLFNEKGIEVITGCLKEYPRDIVDDYLNNKLELGTNTCDH